MKYNQTISEIDGLSGRPDLLINHVVPLQLKFLFFGGLLADVGLGLE
ncbi:MAG: hypothetical protein QM786_18870 [Breznakibacter sp.]